VDQLAPIDEHSPENGASATRNKRQSAQLTYQKQLPDCIPTHDCDKVPWYEAGSGWDMSLECQTIMGDSGFEIASMWRIGNKHRWKLWLVGLNNGPQL